MVGAFVEFGDGDDANGEPLTAEVVKDRACDRALSEDSLNEEARVEEIGHTSSAAALLTPAAKIIGELVTVHVRPDSGQSLQSGERLGGVMVAPDVILRSKLEWHSFHRSGSCQVVHLPTS